MATIRAIEYYERTRRPISVPITHFPDNSGLTGDPGHMGFTPPPLLDASLSGTGVWKITTHSGEMECVQVAPSKCAGSTQGAGIMTDQVDITDFIVDPLSFMFSVFGPALVRSPLCILHRLCFYALPSLELQGAPPLKTLVVPWRCSLVTP